MTLMPTSWPTAADRALALAEALRAEAPTLSLAPRPRAAYDRLVDALNRLPRPLMVLGSLALVGSAMIAPDWFQARMDALSDMPEALWWIIGAVLSLHFGGRYQERSLEARREAAPPPALPETSASPGSDAALVIGTLTSGPNPALDDWRAARG